MPAKPQPPDDPAKGGLERFGLYGTRWGAGAVIGALALLALQSGKPPLPPPPPVDGALPLQQWAVDITPRVLSALVTGALPRPDPRQRKPPCDPDLEKEANGYCWIGLAVTPPCPKGKAWEYEGRCYAYALKVERTPSSGEPHPSNVAGEPR